MPRVSRANALSQLIRLEWGDHPLTAGRLVYLLKLKFGHGLQVAWYRDAVRPQILATPPIRTPDRTCEVHVLTSQGDWLNLIWALKSFYLHSGRRFTLCIHDDGTLRDLARTELRAAFPDARLISREEADSRVNPLLAGFPRSREFRATNTLALKVFDFRAFLDAARMMIFDSDILFFAAPMELLRILETSDRNSLNRDWRAGYTLDPAAIPSALNFKLPELINSGLGLIHKESIRYEWIEEFLTLPGILSHPHQIEQTLIALCSAKFGFTMLPAEYDIHLGPRRPGVPCRHYTGPIRHLMYSEGVRALAADGILDSAPA